MSLKEIAARFPRPIKDFVRRKLNEHGWYDIRDGGGLNKRGFYDIRGVGEITTIDEFKERAFTISKRSRLQRQEEVIALKKKYQQPIFGEISVERLLELQAQIIDPTNVLMFTGSQLTHTLQVLESMEKAGITDREFLATTLIHDLGKLAIFKGEKWEKPRGRRQNSLGRECPRFRLGELHFQLGSCGRGPCPLPPVCVQGHGVGLEVALDPTGM
jgi:Myo-inositol oxygenase